MAEETSASDSTMKDSISTQKKRKRRSLKQFVARSRRANAYLSSSMFSIWRTLSLSPFREMFVTWTTILIVLLPWGTLFEFLVVACLPIVPSYFLKEKQLICNQLIFLEQEFGWTPEISEFLYYTIPEKIDVIFHEYVNDVKTLHASRSWQTMHYEIKAESRKKMTELINTYLQEIMKDKPARMVLVFPDNQDPVSRFQAL